MMKRAPAAFAALYSSKFVALGIQLPFFSGWLSLRGFSAPEIGLLSGGALVGRLALGPLVALWADRQAEPRLALRLVAALFAAGAVVLCIAPPKWLIAAASIAMLWAFGVLVPLADAAALRAQGTGALDFGRTRATGSLAFLLATLGAGEALTRFGLDASVAIMAAAAAATFAATLALPAAPAAPSTSAPLFAEATRLLSSRAFLTALAAAACVQGAHAAYYAFSILHWSGLGYSPRVIGALWAAGVAVEIVLLTRMRRLVAAVRPDRLIVLGAAGAVVRWLAVAAEPPLPVLFLVQALHALSFAATYMGAIAFVDRAVPGRSANAALALNSTAGVGAATGLATVGAGYLYAAAGGPAAYLAMAALAAVGLGLALWLGRIWRGERLF